MRHFLALFWKFQVIIAALKVRHSFLQLDAKFNRCNSLAQRISFLSLYCSPCLEIIACATLRILRKIALTRF